MQVKGSAVKVTPEFVKTKFPNEYFKWIDSLPDESKKILSGAIYATDWFNLTDSLTIPTEKVSQLFFKNDLEAASELGKFSADSALKGIYKIFVRVSSPVFVINRASSVFSTYYNPADIKVIESSNDSVSLGIGGFKLRDELVLYRIAGWMNRTIEITQKSVVKVEVVKNIEKDTIQAIIKAQWS